MNFNLLSIEQTMLANQRTYLAYMRTGFAISAVSATLKKKWIVLFGIIMIVGSTYQYLLIMDNLNKKKNTNSKFLNFLPLIYSILSLGILYIQFKFKS